MEGGSELNLPHQKETRDEWRTDEQALAHKADKHPNPRRSQTLKKEEEPTRSGERIISEGSGETKLVG